MKDLTQIYVIIQSRVILNILETYKDIADTLESNSLKISLSFLESIDLFIENEKKVIKRTPTLRRTRVIKEKKGAYNDKILLKGKGPIQYITNMQRLINNSKGVISRLFSPKKQAQTAISSARKTRKKLRE